MSSYQPTRLSTSPTLMVPPHAVNIWKLVHGHRFVQPTKREEKKKHAHARAHTCTQKMLEFKSWTNQFGHCIEFHILYMLCHRHKCLFSKAYCKEYTHAFYYKPQSQAASKYVRQTFIVYTKSWIPKYKTAKIPVPEKNYTHQSLFMTSNQTLLPAFLNNLQLQYKKTYTTRHIKYSRP